MSTPTPLENRDAGFPETQWSLVLKAREPDSNAAQVALNTLCSRYWYPIYAFIRRKGNGPDRSLDLTQSYFQELLRKNVLTRVDKEKGRFRAFLRKDCANFLIDEHRRATAAIRHPDRPLVSIDVRTAEGRYLKEPEHNETAEKIFERNWARTLLERVLIQFKEEAEESRNPLRFRELKAVLTGRDRAGTYAQLAGRLGMSEQAVATAVHRLRQRYRELLRREIAATVADPADVDDEIRALFEALAS